MPSRPTSLLCLRRGNGCMGSSLFQRTRTWRTSRRGFRSAPARLRMSATRGFCWSGTGSFIARDCSTQKSQSRKSWLVKGADLARRAGKRVRPGPLEPAHVGTVGLVGQIGKRQECFRNRYLVQPGLTIFKSVTRSSPRPSFRAAFSTWPSFFSSAFASRVGEPVTVTW